MRHSSRVAIIVLTVAPLVAFPACQRSERQASHAADSTALARADSIAVRTLIVTFGQKLKQVPLLAADTTVAEVMQANYARYVAPSLLTAWIRHPKSAPGRRTSSPWPDRIEPRAISRKSDRVYLVDGDIVERASAGAHGGETGWIPVQLVVWKGGSRWVITKFEQGQPSAGSTEGAAAESGDPNLTPAAAVEVIRDYYRAINARRYGDAYALWEGDGAASGKSLVEFLNGFAQTRSAEVTFGPPGAIGAAAGSRYVDLPVRITATNVQGARETFAGTYTLRRSVVDGASPTRRSWRIYSADIRRVPTA